jgi:hypothetical protein
MMGTRDDKVLPGISHPYQGIGILSVSRTFSGAFNNAY